MEHSEIVNRLWSGWRSAADEVWETWEEFCMAPQTARTSTYSQHLDALDQESLAAAELAEHLAPVAHAA